MIIKRKLFANPTLEQPPEINQTRQEMSSRDLQIEQMRLQRQVLETQRMRQRIQAEERMQELKQSTQAQKIEQKKDEAREDNQLKVKKIDAQNNRKDVNNIGLYKTKSKPTPTVSMKTNL